MNRLQTTSTHALPGPQDVVRVELKNGLTVLVRENFTSPSVVVDGLLRGGSLWEPIELAGLANFHSDLMTRGTKRHSFDALYEEVESIGASFDVTAGGHTYSFDSKSLAEDLPKMLGLLAEVLREPIFPEEQVEKLRGQILTGLQLRAHNTRYMSTLKFQELAYAADHPYARSISGYPDSVARITRDDIVKFQQHFGPRDAIIVIVGAVRADDAVRMVEAAFGDWENSSQLPAPMANPADPLPESRRGFIAIPGKSQSDLVLGVPGPSRFEPEYQAARVANSILGMFGMYGRLGDSVRQAEGLAYYSYSQLVGGLGPGPWKVMAGVDPANVNRAVDLILTEIGRIVNEPVTDEELNDNKSFFNGQLVLSLETNEGVATTLQSIELYKLGLDYLHRYEGMINALTPDAILAAAARWLTPENYALAVAGPDTNES